MQLSPKSSWGAHTQVELSEMMKRGAVVLAVVGVVGLVGGGDDGDDGGAEVAGDAGNGATSNGTTGARDDLGYPCRELPEGDFDGWEYTYADAFRFTDQWTITAERFTNESNGVFFARAWGEYGRSTVIRIEVSSGLENNTWELSDFGEPSPDGRLYDLGPTLPLDPAPIILTDRLPSTLTRTGGDAFEAPPLADAPLGRDESRAAVWGCSLYSPPGPDAP